MSSESSVATVDLLLKDHSGFTQKKPTLRNALPEIVATVCVGSFHILIGAALGETAVSLPEFKKDFDKQIQPTNMSFEFSLREKHVGLDKRIQPIDTSFVASGYDLGVFAAIFFSKYFMDSLGRISTLKLSSLPWFFACCFLANARHIDVVVGSRLLMGVAAGLSIQPVFFYVMEVASQEYKDTLLFVNSLLTIIGMMLGYIGGAFLSWKVSSWLLLAYCLLPVVLCSALRVPESPVWLISKERYDRAKESLRWLRSWEPENIREKLIDFEFKELVRKHVEKKTASAKVSYLWYSLSKLKEPSGFKPFLIVLFIFILQQYSGLNIVLLYSTYFFKACGFSFRGKDISFLIGVTAAATAIITTPMQRFGPARLSILSCIGMAISMAVSGYYTFLSEPYSTVSLCCIVVYVVFSVLGMFSLPYIAAVKLFPADIRGWFFAFVLSLAHLLKFISIQTYFDMTAFFGGLAYLQWFFSAISALSSIFVYFFLLETDKLHSTKTEDRSIESHTATSFS